MIAPSTATKTATIATAALSAGQAPLTTYGVRGALRVWVLAKHGTQTRSSSTILRGARTRLTAPAGTTGRLLVVIGHVG